MQEGKVYRVKSAFKDDSTIKQHGWLWVLVNLGSHEAKYGSSLGVFRSVATGYDLVLNFRHVEEVSDAGG